MIPLSPHMDEDLHPGKGRPPAQGQPTGQVESWALTLHSGFGAPGSVPVEMGDKYDSCYLPVSLEGLALKWGRQGRVGHKKGIELACPPLRSALGEQLWEGASGVQLGGEMVSSSGTRAERGPIFKPYVVVQSLSRV